MKQMGEKTGFRSSDLIVYTHRVAWAGFNCLHTQGWHGLDLIVYTYKGWTKLRQSISVIFAKLMLNPRLRQFSFFTVLVIGYCI